MSGLKQHIGWLFGQLALESDRWAVTSQPGPPAPSPLPTLHPRCRRPIAAFPPFRVAVPRTEPNMHFQESMGRGLPGEVPRVFPPCYILGRGAVTLVGSTHMA